MGGLGPRLPRNESHVLSGLDLLQQAKAPPTRAAVLGRTGLRRPLGVIDVQAHQRSPGLKSILPLSTPFVSETVSMTGHCRNGNSDIILNGIWVEPAKRTCSLIYIKFYTDRTSCLK